MQANSPTLQEIRFHYLLQLKPRFQEKEANVLLNNILTHFLKLPLYKILSEPNCTLTESDLQKIDCAVSDLLNDKPLQYIIGSVDFCNCEIQVDQRVLIPRPETEELCQFFFKVLEPVETSNLKILDIGTGSGCLAIAIKKRFPGFEVSGLDKSIDAIELARDNANNNQTDIRWIESDILDPDDFTKFPVYDSIISNPPYIPEKDRILVAVNVKNFEPDMALFVPDDDPLCFYKSIRRMCDYNLKPGGLVFLETLENFNQEVWNLFEKDQFDNLDKRLDFIGKERFVVVRKKS